VENKINGGEHLSATTPDAINLNAFGFQANE
jgi:hypothetical protein